MAERLQQDGESAYMDLVQRHESKQSADMDHTEIKGLPAAVAFLELKITTRQH